MFGLRSWQIFLVVGGLLAVSQAALPVWAAHPETGIIPTECIGPLTAATCTSCHFFKLIENAVLFVATDVVPPLAAFLIAIGGFLYLVSGSSETLRSKARGILTWTVLGLVMMFASFLALHLFLKILAGDETTAKEIFLIGSEGFSIQCAIPTPEPTPTPTPTPTPVPGPGPGPAVPFDSRVRTASAANDTCGVGPGQKVGPATTLQEVNSGSKITVCSSTCTSSSGCSVSDTVTVNPNLIKGVNKVVGGGRDLIVTSFTTGPHSDGSSHYAGDAVDTQPIDKSGNPKLTADDMQTLFNSFKVQPGFRKVLCETVIKDARGVVIESPKYSDRCPGVAGKPLRAGEQFSHIHAEFNR